MGYTTALVLKTNWATGPMPLRRQRIPERGEAGRATCSGEGRLQPRTNATPKGRVGQTNAPTYGNFIHTSVPALRVLVIVIRSATELMIFSP